MSSWRGISLLRLPLVMEGEEGSVFGLDGGFVVGREVRRPGYEPPGKDVVHELIRSKWGKSGEWMTR